MIRAGKKVSGRENIIELAERIDRLGFGYVVRKGEGSHRRFGQGVLKTFVKIKAVFQKGTAEGNSRRKIAQPSQMPAINANSRQWIIEFEVPLFAATARLHGNHATGETPILCKETRLLHVDRFDTLHPHHSPTPPRST